MPEPFPKFGARGDLFQPEIDLCFLFCQTARPKPVYENAGAILSVRLLIHPFDLDFIHALAFLAED